MPYPLFRIFVLKNSRLIPQIRHEAFRRSFHKNAPSLQGAQPDECEGGLRKIEMDPACKVALVTNGIAGVGFGCATQLLKAGAKNVVITGDDVCLGREAVHKLNSAFGKNKAMYIGSSVTCMVQFEEAFKTTKETFGCIDIVVNTTIILDDKNWEKEIVTNLVGTIRGTLLAYRYMGKEGPGKGGVVVNCCSIPAIDPLPSAPTFTATHYAIVGLSRSFGHKMHMDKSGIRVVQLVTGVNQTDLYKNIEKKAMTPYLANELNQFVAKAKKQTPGACGQALIHVIKHGPNGSVWVIEASRLYELNIPHWSKYNKLAAQYI